ncbi:formimidoylglutamase [Azohydromonas caseinilytica]|uniref:Formimidoylglutamase n=1 Tax=Azohydromonas caseinilytica TaxID=2728836 RepID=A0A848FJQ9_9BURK|nr:formimidoylglutamase [Azohydromonas caseinilytica]NML19115.1 formimidoylglutamase [Azohydromonas caseinilytica]
MRVIDPPMDCWHGRVDAEEGELGRRWHQLVQPLSPTSQGVVLTGFACDAGVARNQGRVGAREGPRALRAMLANLPVHGQAQLSDAGDVVCEGDALEHAQARLSGLLCGLLERGLFPIVLGGGHEMAFGSFGGLARHLARRHPAPRVGIINLDAHLDLRLAQRASSGTPFRQIAEDCAVRGWPFHYCCLGVSEFANTPALFERARRLGVTWLRDEDMGETRLPRTLALLERFLAGVDQVYLTICLDVLPAAVAPGVSAPAALGVPLVVVEALIDRVAASGKLRLADVAELNPRLDIDGQTARVAARLVGRLAQRRQQAQTAGAALAGALA